MSKASGKTAPMLPDAETYDCTTLPMLTKLLRGVVDGPLRVHTFGGSHGRLSSSLM